MLTRERSTTYLFLLASVAAIGGFLFGYDTAVINGCVIALQEHFNATSWTIGFAVSSALLASAVGAVFAGPTADRFGRRPCMIVSGILFLISAIGSGFPLTLYDFILWRMIGGLAVGAASVIAPAYIAEIAPASIRGRLGSLQQMAIVIGIFIALLSNYFLVLISGSASSPLLHIPTWKWMFWIEALPATLYILGALYIPESPRYLVACQNTAAATQVLKKLQTPDPTQKINEIRNSLQTDHRARWQDLLSPNTALLPIVWIGLGLSTLQQFVGINVIFYYSSVLWQTVGFSEKNALAITMITGLTNILTTALAIATIDKIGRKPLLIAGSIGMTLTLTSLTLIFALSPLSQNNTPQLSSTTGLLALILANAYVFCFGFSWGPVVWVLLGEMFSNRIRAFALALAAAVQWLANFAVSTTFPPLTHRLGIGAAYGLYAFFAFLSIFFTLRFLRETKGRELEQMTN